MHLTDLEIQRLVQKLRFRVGYEVGYACPDVEDLVQETLRRFLSALQSEKMHSPEAAASFINGICRNVVLEYRRRLYQDTPIPDSAWEASARGLSEGERFELREATLQAMKQLSPRDRLVLHSFYLEERPLEEILEETGLTLENFRVVLCRAKERFRQIYSHSLQFRASSRH